MAQPGVTEAYIADWIASTIDIIIQLNYYKPAGLHTCRPWPRLTVERRGPATPGVVAPRRTTRTPALDRVGDEVEERFQAVGVEWTPPTIVEGEPVMAWPAAVALFAASLWMLVDWWCDPDHCRSPRVRVDPLRRLRRLLLQAELGWTADRLAVGYGYRGGCRRAADVPVSRGGWCRASLPRRSASSGLSSTSSSDEHRGAPSGRRRCL